MYKKAREYLKEIVKKQVKGHGKNLMKKWKQTEQKIKNYFMKY